MTMNKIIDQLPYATMREAVGKATDAKVWVNVAGDLCILLKTGEFVKLPERHLDKLEELED